MRKSFLVIAAALLAASSAHAQQTVKIGLIEPYSGQFADAATQQDNAIKLFMKQNGDMVAGKKIEIIRKDVGGINPPVAKRLAQELVTRDKVDILAGFVLTPNAMAAGDISKDGKKFMVVMNAATAIITTKSPYMARTSLTIPQLNTAFGKWAATKGGVKKAYTMVSDYGPGHDAEQSFQAGFKAGGGDHRRLRAHAGRQSGFLGLRAARQGSQPARHLRLHPRRRAAGRLRQGLRRPRHRCQEDQGHGPARDHRRARAQEHGRHRHRHHHLRSLRLQSSSPR